MSKKQMPDWAKGQADPNGIHLRSGPDAEGYAVYQIWNGDTMICAVYGGCSASMAAHICDMFVSGQAQKYLRNEDVPQWWPAK